MSSPEEQGQYSVLEYLTLEEKADYKSEYYNGEIFAMSGKTRDHCVIGVNIAGELGGALMGKDCSVFGSDLKVRIEAADSNVYPDGMVICGPEEYYADRKDLVTNPIVIIEVLSDSTAAWDRGGKFRKYETLPSLREYILVEQNAPQVDVFRRQGMGSWTLERYDGLEEMVELRSLEVSIAARGIYHRVEFPENPVSPS